MIKEVKGNLLDVQSGVIAHQVNCQGVMGAACREADPVKIIVCQPVPVLPVQMQEAW